MERLTQAQLLRLYIEYVKYRDSLKHPSTPMSVASFYEKSKAKYNYFKGDSNEIK